MNPATGPCVGNRRPGVHSGSRAPWAGCSDIVHSRLACRVLAPPEAPGRRPRSASVDVSQPSGMPSGDFWSSTTSFASQLLSHFRVPAFAAASPDAVLREASTKERELQKAKAPVDVSAFLLPVGIWELKHIRKLSSLTALTYYMNLVTPRRMLRSHGLELVTTSRACEIRPYEHNKTAEEVGADGDGMAVSVLEAREVYQALKRDGGAAAGAGPGPAGSSNIVTVSRELPYEVVPQPLTAAPSSSSGGGPAWSATTLLAGSAASVAAGQPAWQAPAASVQSQGGGGGAPGQQMPSLAAQTSLPRMLRTPAEVVAAKLAEAAMAASAAAATAAAATSPLASAAESLYAGLASLPIGSALVGANNRASNALLPSSSPLPGAAAAAGGVASAADGAATAAAAQVQAAVVGSADGGAAAAAAYLGLGSRKATAASITAMATDQIRQQTMRSLPGSGSGSNRNGGGMAAVSASGLMSPAPVGTAAAAVAAAAPAAGAAASSSSSSSLVFSASSTPGCPSEWFVMDDPATHTRTFVIQGSDTLDHWKLNLTFDPVTFEEPSLGVKVHRGVYEASLVLYERFLPLVYEHLESSPFSKIAFTGHSIGGSMATLLMLMYRCRGVLPPHSIATVYTFGAPAVFCQTQSVHHNHLGLTHGSAATSPVPCPPSGSNSWVSPSLWSAGSISSVEDPSTLAANDSALDSSSGGGSSGCACGADLLFARLHLPDHIVRNVIMARDIVPRAFACDYRPVAEIFKSWGSSFRDHCCLNRDGRKHLYYFVGRMYILQPDSWHSFTASDPDHPMLPPGPELFALVEPAVAAPWASAAASSPSAATSAGATNPTRNPNPAGGPAARSVTEAIWELMDCPHPLETLADPGAYLASGSISRYHNPDHYTKALGRIRHLKRLAERRTEHRPSPLLPTADGDAGGAVTVPWDSSDGLDLDLHLVAPAFLSADAHTYR